MNIHCFGINHKTTPIEFREQLAFNSHQLDKALASLGQRKPESLRSVQEMVILSTCNRVEIYAVSEHRIFEALETFLSETHGFPLEAISSTGYQLLGSSAINHLFRVSAGLNSIIIGESQILGQVSEAYQTALKHGAVGNILGGLFLSVIKAGKRVRAETKINHNPSSISTAAVHLISKKTSQFQSANVLIIGAGEMAELAVKALQKRGISRITVANRSLENGRTLAERWNGHAVDLESLHEHLCKADVVITSTGAPGILISKSLLENVLLSRPDRPLVLMDIAVPRDVDPAVDELPNVHRYDIDGITKHFQSSLSKRKKEIPSVEVILEEEMLGFQEYLATLDIIPVITELRKQASAIREAQLEKALRRMPDLSPENRQQLDLMTKAIVKKILHRPTLHLRKEAGGSNAANYAETTRSLFGLKK